VVGGDVVRQASRELDGFDGERFRAVLQFVCSHAIESGKGWAAHLCSRSRAFPLRSREKRADFAFLNGLEIA
jgi:hypothetical protein